LLLVLASSLEVSAPAATPADAAAPLFVKLLLRVSLIAFARSIPHPAFTFAVYQRVFTLLAAALELISPSLIDNDGPLVQRLAADDDDDSCAELVHFYRQFVLKDDATTGTCSSALQAAVLAARSPEFAVAAEPIAALEDPAAEVFGRMQDEGDGAVQAHAAVNYPAVLHAENQVTFSLLPC
jgi:hypothetical protein